MTLKNKINLATIDTVGNEYIFYFFNIFLSLKSTNSIKSLTNFNNPIVAETFTNINFAPIHKNKLW